MRSVTRLIISLAALLVKVSSKIRSGETPCSKRYATRYVNVRVFPEPAPAMTSAGPGNAVTAERCASFNSAS